jgi:hypothetical protein
MVDKVVGVCSRCNGYVVERVVPTFNGVLTEKPSCCKCGATRKVAGALPVIEMDESTAPQLLLD